MKKGDHFIIVIGRHFGAGGRAVGKLLAEKLDIPYYDNEILKETADQYGLTNDIFARADEKRPSFLKRLLTQSYGIQETYNPEAISSETLYQAQSKVIREIADKGPCVFVGRSADYILRDYPGLISVFLHAPIDYRAEKILKRGDASSLCEASEIARKMDKDREAYYNYFTGKEWGKASTYTLSIDASSLPPDKIAELIIDYLKKYS